jgi:uncharacterized protein
MAGILVELLISLLLLKLIEKKGLSVLGLLPTLKRIQQFFIGLFIAITLASIFHITRSALTGISWKYNETYSFNEFCKGLCWMLRSVLYEELIFRGALFYIALKRLGTTKGFWLSVIAFGVYHWFSFNAWNHPIQMIFIFLITAAAGWMYAYAFMKTNSLFLPIGLHLGWNTVGSIVFSDGSIGKHLLIPIYQNSMQQNNLWSSVFMVLYQMLVPAFFTWLYVRKMNGDKAASF